MATRSRWSDSLVKSVNRRDPDLLCVSVVQVFGQAFGQAFGRDERGTRRYRLRKQQVGRSKVGP